MSEDSIKVGNRISATEVASKLAEKAPSSHTHDDRYYTESEIDNKITSINTSLNGKAPSSHTHDDRYYTESEIDNKITSINGNGNQISSKVVGTTTSGGGSQGYIRFPGGLILMWWSISVSGSSEKSANLPYTGVFKSGYSISMTGIARTDHAAWPKGVNSYGYRQESSGTYTYYFIAIGT